MTQVLLQPAFNKASRDHLKRSVLNPVPLEQLRQFLTPVDLRRLEGCSREACPVWGIGGSQDGANESIFERLEHDDIVVFGSAGHTVGWGRVAAKVKSKEISNALWSDAGANTRWSMVYVLDRLRHVRVPVKVINSDLGKKPVEHWQRVRLVNASDAANVVARLTRGVSEPQDEAHDPYDYLVNQVGGLRDEIINLRAELANMKKTAHARDSLLDATRADLRKLKERLDPIGSPGKQEPVSEPKRETRTIPWWWKLVGWKDGQGSDWH